MKLLLLSLVTALSVAAHAENFLLTPGYYNITNDKIIQNSSSTPENTSAIQAECDQDQFHFLVQKLSSNLPGITLQYYAGFCLIGVSHNMQFLNGKIYLYNGSDVDMTHNVGTYDDQSVHILMNLTDTNGAKLTLKLDAVSNSKGGMDAVVYQQYLSPKFQSQYMDQAEITK